MARTIRDITLALDAVVGPEATDLRSLPMPETSWSRSIEHLSAPRKVGWSPDLGYATIDKEVLATCEAAVQKLADAGTEIVELPAVFDGDPAMPWITMAMAGNERALGHLRGTDEWDLVDPGHRRMIDAFGARPSASDLLAANDECHRLNVRLVELFHQVPLILCPTVAGLPGAPGADGTVDGELTPQWVALTYPFNMTRSPAGTVRAGFSSSGLPIGLQVVGPQHADVAVLRALCLLEDLIGADELAPI
jgi:aspartyl-tRNA(Asn)/glutamyl-tRNA(Gln) amidotransferase subunit A